MTETEKADFNAADSTNGIKTKFSEPQPAVKKMKFTPKDTKKMAGM